VLHLTAQWEVDLQDIHRIRAYLRDAGADVLAVRARLLEELAEPTKSRELGALLAAADEAFQALGESSACAATGSGHSSATGSPTTRAETWPPARHLPDWPPYEREAPGWGSARHYEAKWRTNPNQEAITKLRAEFARMRDALVARGAERARTMSEEEIAAAVFEEIRRQGGSDDVIEGLSELVIPRLAERLQQDL
jgi:hypothetical protein